MSDTIPTPRTEDRINRISIENEDSCCSIYVKIDGAESDCDLIDADFARQLERELAELRAATAWREISEAPKDGSEILLFEKYGTSPFVGYWSPRIGRWEASTEHYSVNGDACIFTSCLQSDILHFMPLPKPPTL